MLDTLITSLILLYLLCFIIVFIIVINASFQYKKPLPSPPKRTDVNKFYKRADSFLNILRKK
jgi:hypothetical protein